MMAYKMTLQYVLLLMAIDITTASVPCPASGEQAMMGWDKSLKILCPKIVWQC